MRVALVVMFSSFAATYLVTPVAPRIAGPHLDLRMPVVHMTVPNPDSVGHFVLVGDAPQDLLTASGFTVAEASVLLISSRPLSYGPPASITSTTS